LHIDVAKEAVSYQTFHTKLILYPTVLFTWTILYGQNVTAEQRNGNTVLLYDITLQACTNVPAASVGRVDEDILEPVWSNSETTPLTDTVL
jgi:hypothetical protein